MIKLRLKKYGRKGQPCYRIVAMDSRTKRDGAAIEELGFYNPRTCTPACTSIPSTARNTAYNEL